MKTSRWCIAVAIFLALAGTTYAGSPGLSMLFLPQCFGQEPVPVSPRPAQAPASSAAQSKRVVYPVIELVLPETDAPATSAQASSPVSEAEARKILNRAVEVGCWVYRV